MRIRPAFLLLAALAAAPAEAATFRFTFSNVDGDVAGTVIGTISGLAESGTSAATGVVVTSAPILYTTYPFDVLAQGWTVPINSFTVTNGAITAASFLAGAASGFNEPQLDLGYVGAQFNMGDNAYGVFDNAGRTLTFTRLATLEVPEPAALGLFAAALAGLGLARRLRPPRP